MGLFSFLKRKNGTDKVSQSDVDVEVEKTETQVEKTIDTLDDNDGDQSVAATSDAVTVGNTENTDDASSAEVASGEITKEEIEQAKQDLDKGLNKTRFSFIERITKAIVGKSKVDDDVLDNLEEVLVTSDVGVETTLKIIKRIEERVARDKYVGTNELNKILREEIVALLQENNSGDGSTFRIPDDKKPYVMMVVGVNGVGKTTTIGKLAYNFKRAGFKVVLGASDTFRAAAVDQLKIWADRVGVSIVSQGMGADPASVAFDTVKSAVAQDADVVIIDTAGRLHNKIGLMNELSKIKKVCQKVIPDAPHEVLLVLDASTGQNAIEQARQFIAATEVNALALTKLDGTAKGGVVIGISDQFKIPVKYIGVGEKKENLQIFDRKEFVDSLFN
ncbi:MAG: signal recognition particle-docking protein FtsY [Candidatus Limimorpha sp.]